MKILWTFVIITLTILPSGLIAQSDSEVAATEIVLLSSGPTGLSNKQSDSILISIQKKMSLFTALSIFVKTNFLQELNKEERAAFEKCSNVQCMLQFAATAGFQRLTLCKIIKKKTLYKFVTTGYDIESSQKYLTITDSANCKTSSDLDKFISRAAGKIGRANVNYTAFIDAQRSKSNLWWYVGSAAATGAAAVVYFLAAKPKESSAATVLPNSLPLPSDMP